MKTPPPESRSAADLLREMAPKKSGRRCHWCEHWLEDIQACVKVLEERPELPFIAMYRALKAKANGAIHSPSSLRTHLVEHEPVTWEKIIGR